eukprot:gene15584-21050_t
MSIKTIILFSLCIGATALIGTKPLAIGKSRLAMQLTDTQSTSKMLAKFILCSGMAYLIAPDNLQPSLGSMSFGMIKPAQADIRAQQKRTYFRFTPKFIKGCTYYKTDLKSAIESGDWDTVTKFFDVYVSKVNKNDPNQIDATDSYLNDKFLRPMQLLSGSFAERGISAKQTQLNDKKLAFESSMKELEGSVKDLPGEGFFASPIKAPTGAARTKQAKEAYEKGKVALNEFISIFNSGLMLELNKIDKI